MVTFVPSHSLMTEQLLWYSARLALAGFLSKCGSRALFTFLSYLVLPVVNLLTHSSWPGISLGIKLEASVALQQSWTCLLCGPFVYKKFFSTTRPDSRFTQVKTSFDTVCDSGKKVVHRDYNYFQCCIGSEFLYNWIIQFLLKCNHDIYS